MAIEYLGLSAINGPMVVLEGVSGAAYDEIVEMVVDGNKKKLGRVIEVYEDKAIIQVFEGTEGLGLRNVHTRLTGHPMVLGVSEDMLGRTMNGIGVPIDGLGEIVPEKMLDVNGQPLNPVTREYPRNYIRTFEESGVSSHVAMFLNLANDPVVERLITPKVALTLAEYLAFEKNMHILVILTDMTSFAEAMREVSSSKGEIPSRKGFPGYLYSELAALYERAGIVKGINGSVTQIPILTMPNDDITHPIPDLTGYITEGQIVLDRSLNGQSIYPPINVLPSLSRLMKDGIGEGFTRADHQAVANQLFSCYAKVGDARALASVIGEDELSPLDKKYLVFGKAFEEQFVGQDPHDNRNIIKTLDIGWKLLGLLPREELDRIDTKILDQYYQPASPEEQDGSSDVR